MPRKFLMTFASLATVLAAADVQTVEEIIAKVNGDIVTRGEIERTKRQLEEMLKSRKITGTEADRIREEATKNALRDRIDSLLLVNRGKELNINIDGEVSKYVADLMKQTKEVDPDKFAAIVRAQTGQSFEDWKNETKNQMLTQRVIGQEVNRKINVSKQEIEKVYNENKDKFLRKDQVFLRELFLTTAGKTPAEEAAIEKKAKDLVARARKNEKFGDLVRDNSEAESTQNGGDIGGYEKGQLDPVLEALVWEQNKGYVTDPVKRPNGWLILRVEERFKAGQATLEEVEGDIRDRLYGERMQPEIRKYLTELRTNAFLEIREGWLDSAPAPGKSTAWSEPAALKPETITKGELEARTRRRRLLWAVPIPGTSTSMKKGGESGTSKSKTVKQ
ncbi:MAG: peptidylprolyl isomerase [Bryobacteraceae bacterium]|nr:peptidylprolyl isomerase [Bryobacteraceae bacterium]